MNENTVSLHLTEASVLAVFALLGEHCSSSVLSDLGLDPIYSALADNFEVQEVINGTGFITRESASTPIQVVPRNRGRHTIIDLI